METEAFTRLITSNQPVLVDFSAEWCEPCRLLKEIIQCLQAKQGGTLRVINVDVDKQRNLSAQYAVQAVPTLMIFKNGRQLWRQSGLIRGEELNKVIEIFR